MTDWTFSPRQVERAMAEAQKLRAGLDEDDDKLVLDTIEGQTDILEIIDGIAEAVIRDNLMVERGKERLKRLETRVERRRGTLARMLDALSIGSKQPIERALYTLSLAWRSKPIVTNEMALAPEYIRRAADMKAIHRDLLKGIDVDGAELSNPQASIRLTSK